MEGYLNVCTLEKSFLILVLFTNNLSPSAECCHIYVIYFSVYLQSASAIDTLWC